MASRTRSTRSKHFRPSRPAAHEQPSSVTLSDTEPGGSLDVCKESEDDEDEQYVESDGEQELSADEDADEVEESMKSEDSGYQPPASKSKRKVASKPVAQQSKRRKIKTKPAAPGNTVSKFIPNKHLPETEVDYKDDNLHPNTLHFLEELAENNNRDWFSENDIIYRAAKADFEGFVSRLSEKITEIVDTTVPELPLKDLIFRIYRDIRFSNDQTPYKVYFSAAWSRTGRKGPYAHYYVKIQPQGNSMVGGGLWHMESQPLSLLRQSIAVHPHRLKKILLLPGIAKDLLGLSKQVDEEKAVEAFVANNSEDALKSAPKGYSKDHADIKLLRLRSFTLRKQLKDGEITSNNVINVIVDILTKIEPLVTYLNSVVMPDLELDEAEL